MQIEIVLYDGFDELDAIAPFEVLQSARSAGADFDTRLVSWSGAQEVVAAHGLRIALAQTTASAQPDLVIVPGGGWIMRSQCGARAEVERGAIPQRLAALHRAGTTIAAVCTGAMLVASAGLLRGKAAATHHGAREDLLAAGADIVAARVVDEGTLLTSGGVTSGLDLALWVVERFAGPTLAAAVERELEYERRGTVWRRAAAS